MPVPAVASLQSPLPADKVNYKHLVMESLPFWKHPIQSEACSSESPASPSTHPTPHNKSPLTLSERPGLPGLPGCVLPLGTERSTHCSATGVLLAVFAGRTRGYKSL